LKRRINGCGERIDCPIEPRRARVIDNFSSTGAAGAACDPLRKISPACFTPAKKPGR
jgi:hypothetical protein